MIQKKIILANPRGFCAGVDRAILIVEKALNMLGAPIYVRHEVVHNKFVVDNLKQKGAIFVDELDEVPDNSTVIFSAHGVAKQIQNQAQLRKLNVFDATCPLVTKVHIEVARYAKNSNEVVLIGHAGHPEVEGTMGQYHNDNAGIYLVESPSDVDGLIVKNPNDLYFVTQTTLSVSDTQLIVSKLKDKFPNIKGPKQDDICYATQNRQDAVKLLSEKSDLVLVVGSINSSNSNRLRELAEKSGTKAYLIDNASHIKTSWIESANVIGITAGASAPEILVQEVISYLQDQLDCQLEEVEGKEETIHFALPKELR